MSWTVYFVDNTLRLKNPETILQMRKVQGKRKFILSYAYRMKRREKTNKMQDSTLLNRNLHCDHILLDSAPQPLPTTSSRTRTTHQMQQQGLCSPEDGYNDARNTLRQKLIIKI